MNTNPTRNPLIAALLMGALLICLSACGRSLTRPAAPQSLPAPPRVDCELQLGDQSIKPNPTTTDQIQWTQWANYIYGLITNERQDRAHERQCVRDLKKKGVIR